jgi:fructokinase
MIIGAIEAGGTKFICALLAAERGDRAAPQALAKASIPTTTAEATLAATRDFFKAAFQDHGTPECIGIGSFGPVDLRPASPTWGFITSTPKPGWRDTDLAGFVRRELDVSVVFDTDVNAAAYGEYFWGAARGLKDFVYITVGTGIGGGVFSGGSLVHGLLHPELGHVRLAREAEDRFPGACPFHKDCLEGMAAGPAIAQRWNARPESLPPGHPAWNLEARYLARAVAAYTFTLSPERVIVGGGIGMRPGLLETAAAMLREELGGYLPALDDAERLEAYLVRPSLGHEAGLLGAGALALRFCSE